MRATPTSYIEMITKIINYLCLLSLVIVSMSLAHIYAVLHWRIVDVYREQPDVGSLLLSSSDKIYIIALFLALIATILACSFSYIHKNGTAYFMLIMSVLNFFYLMITGFV